MNDGEMPQTEDMSTPNGMWSTPTSQARSRPTTMHGGFAFNLPDDFASLASWDSASLSLQQTPSETAMSRPVSMHQDFFPPLTLGNVPWMQKPCEDSCDDHGLDHYMSIGQAYTSDEAVPVLDLRYQGSAQEGDQFNFDGQVNQRRMSGSSFTMSTTGGMSDMPSYEEFSAALSEAPSFSSDYPPTSNRTSLMSSTQLSPVASPRMTPQTRTDLVRTQSRGRGASPSPRPGVRSAPYSVEGPRVKRWSTGTYGTNANRRPSPFMYHPGNDAFGAHQRMCSQNSSPTISSDPLPLNYGNLQAAQQAPYNMMAGPQMYQRNSMLLPSQLPSQLPPHQSFHTEMNHFETPPPLLSHGLFRMLQSNADPHSLHGHYTDLSDPPDLYAALQEEQIPPPPEDMNPSDPDMVPHEQELRFEGDLYTPRWVRGHGNKREGWCGICKPGRWLVLKNSAFWYDKSFTHGISAATGSPFHEPQQTRRMDGNPDVWEGLCGSCNDWIALVSSKKKGTTWFRHAYKCHTHPKVKDTPKRRRETNGSRILAASSMAKPKNERPETPHSRPSSMCGLGTPTQGMLAQPTSHPQPHLTPVTSQPLHHHSMTPPPGMMVPHDGFANMI